jgi:transposase
MYHEIDDKIRFLVIYQDVTKSVPSIQHYTGIAESTIKYWITRTKANENILEVNSGRGRKRKINTDLIQELREKIERDPFKASLRTIAPSYDTSHTTIAFNLHSIGFEYKKVKVQKKLTDGQKLERLAFCVRMLEDPTQVHRIWFSDEMGFNLQEMRDKVWTNDNTSITDKPQNLKLNAWAAISFFGKTSLHIYEENLDSTAYRKILEARKDQLIRANWRHYYFQQDNLRTHWTPHVKSWFSENCIKLLVWPSYSPDFNPIENLWGWLKAEVKKSNPQTLGELRASMESNWNKIDVDSLKPYIQSLPRRFFLCIQNDGDRTGY